MTLINGVLNQVTEFKKYKIMSTQTLTREEIAAKQIEAREMVESRGLPQNQIALKLGISSKTIGAWIVKFRWTKNNELVNKRKQAKELVLQQGFTQKEAAKIVGVSERSICEWAKKYKWLTKKRRYATPTIEQIKFSVDNFLLYVDCNAPALSKQLRELSVHFYREEPKLLTMLENEPLPVYVESEFEKERLEYMNSQVDFNQEWD